jgi:hypothetical protein
MAESSKGSSHKKATTHHSTNSHSHASHSSHGSSHSSHKAEAPKHAASSNGQASDVTERAEELVDQLGERFGKFLTNLATQVNRWSARAREEAEDIVAEAQSLRNKGRHQRNGKR